MQGLPPQVQGLQSQVQGLQQNIQSQFMQPQQQQYQPSQRQSTFPTMSSNRPPQPDVVAPVVEEQSEEPEEPEVSNESSNENQNKVTTSTSPSVPSQCKPEDTSSVEMQLRKYGYSPLARVIVQPETGQQQGIFIKALNPIGILVFVHLDDGGHVSVNSRDLTVIQKGSIDVIPYSLKEGSYKQVAPYARGVAIECNKGICIIHHDESNPGNMKEVGYEYNNNALPTYNLDVDNESHRNATLATQHADMIMADDSLNVLPVVSLQDIKANPAIVLVHTEIAHDRITRMAYSSCMSDLETFNQAYMEMTTAAKKFVTGYYATTAQNNDSTNIFRGMAKRYLQQPPQTPAALDDYNYVMENLKTREELRHELVRCCRALAGESQNLKSITKDVMYLYTHCLDKNNAVMGVPPSSAQYCPR